MPHLNNLLAPDTRTGAGSIVAIVLVLFALNLSGLLTNTEAVTAVTSLALLIFGMPHGSFDLALLRSRTISSAALISLYIACAAVMYLLWHAAPMVALAVFLVMAVVHFSEDWAASGSRFLALGTALGFVAAPALFHTDHLRSLFEMLTRDPAAVVLADGLLLLAPVSLAIATITVSIFWQIGQKPLAVSAASALAAMLVLPPVQGFAVFFCLVHSALQFRSHAQSLDLHGFRSWRGIVVPVSLGGLGVAAIVLALAPSAPVETSLFITSFTALSVLTAPHMVVPLLLRTLRPQPLFAAA